MITCSSCNKALRNGFFSKKQAAKGAHGRCKSCVSVDRPARLVVCHACGQEKTLLDIPRAQLERDPKHLVCSVCTDSVDAKGVADSYATHESPVDVTLEEETPTPAPAPVAAPASVAAPARLAPPPDVDPGLDPWLSAIKRRLVQVQKAAEPTSMPKHVATIVSAVDDITTQMSVASSAATCEQLVSHGLLQVLASLMKMGAKEGHLQECGSDLLNALMDVTEENAGVLSVPTLRGLAEFSQAMRQTEAWKLSEMLPLAHDTSASTMASLRVAALKDAGKAAYASEEYEKAHALYVLAGDTVKALGQRGAAGMEHELVLLLSNQSAASLKLRWHQTALREAEQAVELEPVFVKGHWRKACALEALKRPREAITCLTQMLKLDTTNIPARKKLTELQQQVKPRVESTARKSTAPREPPRPSVPPAVMRQVAPAVFSRAPASTARVPHKQKPLSTICRVCPQPGVQKCSHCLVTAYCGREHQKSDWAGHRRECQLLQLAQVKAAGGGTSETDSRKRT